MEASEEDEAIFEYAGDVLPSLGMAMTPDTFAPYFIGSLPLLMKKMKPHCSSAERSFAIGTMADCVKALEVINKIHILLAIFLASLELLLFSSQNRMIHNWLKKYFILVLTNLVWFCLQLFSVY